MVDYINDGEVTLEDNQVIQLFELAYTNNTSSPSYDMQDNVVILTF